MLTSLFTNSVRREILEVRYVRKRLLLIEERLDKVSGGYAKSFQTKTRKFMVREIAKHILSIILSS